MTEKMGKKVDLVSADTACSPTYYIPRGKEEPRKRAGRPEVRFLPSDDVRDLEERTRCRTKQRGYNFIILVVAQNNEEGREDSILLYFLYFRL